MNPKTIIDGIDDFSEKLNQAGIRSSTLKRLKEAGFFLGKMNETYFAPDHQFDCYVTAYIMIARSVTWIMQSEFRHKEGFSEWYKTKQISDQIEQLLKKFKKVRNAISKQKPLDLHVRYSFTIDNFSGKDHTPMTQEDVVNYLNQLQGQEIELNLVDESNRDSARLITHVKAIEMEKVEHEDFTDILEECKVYFAFLAGITLECLSRFHESFKKSNTIISIERRP